MKTIVFLGTNKSGSSREAVRAAERLGYFTVVFTDDEKQLLQRTEYPDVHRMILINTNDHHALKQEIVKLKMKGLDIKTIVSFVDSNVHMASILCDEFCNSNTCSNSIEIMENKENTRVFLKNQSYTPNFLLIQPGESIPTDEIHSKFQFPVMVKLPNSTGSKDVRFTRGMRQLEKAVKSLRGKNPNDSIIIEEYFEGDQYLVEVIVSNYQPHIIGIVQQEISQGERFIVTGYGLLVDVQPSLQKGIETLVHSILRQFGIQNGALHLEVRLTKDGWKLVEINPRISGGAMNQMIKAAYGINLVEETLKLYLGKTPSLTKKVKNYVYTQYVIVSQKGILAKVTGKAKAKKLPGVIEVYVKPKKGAWLIPPLSMGHRYAYVIAVGDSFAEAERRAKNAARTITFHLAED
ncbi:ATP-grasp domain-containing protein [Sporosarcina sp. HYO08]|uniref:ATP-grasp domain-containing protein n=1 Tax=Sporosarcina sp. HYO08 TaxID=1759557 RepID=UPI00079AAA74|nr:ATP-grasp domain-containing protein [Sporosarcina sp. HYO08]KXH79762.1 biotin carboxylase [Sporosarcina sp. HYO08]